MDVQDHQFWMKKAIELAKRSWGETHPNPMVGAILALQGKVLAEGFHKKAGCHHAERAALTSIELNEKEKEHATLYITLEPCSTHGRTPPCTDIILEKGIKNLVIGTLDPNPQHQGRGIDLLRNRGLKIEVGVMENACRDLNLIFNHNIVTQKPFIALKSAITLDGKIATRKSLSKWITGSEARADVMHWRSYFPAIGVGAGTVLADNPSLTVRDNEKTIKCPVRLVFDRSLKTLGSINSLKLFNDKWADKTVLITSDKIPETTLQSYKKKKCKICQLPFEGKNFPVNEWLQWCWDQQLWGIFIEGGQALSSSILNLEAADYLFVYQAPKLFASDQAPAMVSNGIIDCPSEAPYLENPVHEILNQDILTRGHLTYPRKSI